MAQWQQKIIIVHTSLEEKAKWLKLLASEDWEIEYQSANANLIELISNWLGQKIPLPILMLIDMAAQTPDGHFFQATSLARWCKEEGISLKIVGIHARQETIGNLESNLAKYQGLTNLLPKITENNCQNIITSLEEILGIKLRLSTETIVSPVKEIPPVKEKTPPPTQEKPPLPIKTELPPQKQENSLESLSEAIKENPKSATLYCERGDLNLSLGGEKAAFADYQIALKLDPKSEQTYLSLGIAFYKLSNYAAAIKNLDQVLKFNDKNAIAYYHRGLARFHSGDEGGARKDYDQAIKLKPDFSQAYNDRAFLLYLLGKIKEALQNYDLAIKYDPDFADPYYNRGNIYSDLARFEESIDDYSQAIRCNPNLAPAYGNRGIAYFELDQIEQAIEDTTRSANLFKVQGYEQNYQQALETLKEMRSS